MSKAECFEYVGSIFYILLGMHEMIVKNSGNQASEDPPPEEEPCSCSTFFCFYRRGLSMRR
ncbi:MAG: hypothetical protein K0R67_3114 [Paenibacillus sp.]|nr:hypothetical protein [Paenibacillus sp.]